MKIAMLCTSTIVLFAFSGNVSVAATPKPKPVVHAAAQQQQEVAYSDLGKYLGKRISVRSTLGTLRSGTLIKYSATSIDLTLDGGAQLSMPANTIRSVSIPILPVDPLFPATSDRSAKKN